MSNSERYTPKTTLGRTVNFRLRKETPSIVYDKLNEINNSNTSVGQYIAKLIEKDVLNKDDMNLENIKKAINELLNENIKDIVKNELQYVIKDTLKEEFAKLSESIIVQSELSTTKEDEREDEKKDEENSINEVSSIFNVDDDDIYNFAFSQLPPT